MNTTTIIVAIIAAIVLLIVGGFLGVVFSRRQRTKKLKEKFGPEYERTVKVMGDQSKAEEELDHRLEHVKELEIQPLSDEQKEHYATEWQATQMKFVDRPVEALREADQLIKKIMFEMGYPVEDFDRRAADISVDYPDLVVSYRRMRDIADNSEYENIDTEEMRLAMIHCRALYEKLLGMQVVEQEEL